MKTKAAIYAENYRKKNKEKVLETQRNYRKNNPELFRAHDKKYREGLDEAEKRRIWKREYDRVKNKKQNDSLYNCKHLLRQAVSNSFYRISANKYTNTEELLGCTWEEAKVHIESLFSEGMSWDNHGEWHIDHIKPVCKYTHEDLHLMNHISNLKPMWGSENQSKGGKYLDVSSDESDNRRTIREEVVEQGPKKENSSIV